MVLKAVTLGCLLLGLILLVVTSFNYFRFMRKNKQRYQDATASLAYFALKNVISVICLAYVVAMVYVYTFDLGYPGLYAAVVLLLVAIFIWLANYTQRAFAEEQRERSIEIMKNMVTSAEAKDRYGKDHSQKVYLITELIFKELPPALKKRLNLPKLLDAAILHDIGKISIPDQILNKDGQYNAEDWNWIKQHAKIGSEILINSNYAAISQWIYYHHERIDGKGYYGLKDAEIPLEAKIIAVADTYAALTSYKIHAHTLSHQEAMAILTQVAGTQLDGEIVGCLRKIDADEFWQVLA